MSRPTRNYRVMYRDCVGRDMTSLVIAATAQDAVDQVNTHPPGYYTGKLTVYAVEPIDFLWRVVDGKVWDE